MELINTKGQQVVDNDGSTYYFCSTACRSLCIDPHGIGRHMEDKKRERE
jgi:ribosomal protein L24E